MCLSQPPAKSDGVDLLNFNQDLPKFSVANAGAASSFSDPRLNCAYRCNVSLEAQGGSAQVSPVGTSRRCCSGADSGVDGRYSGYSGAAHARPMVSSNSCGVGCGLPLGQDFLG